MFERRNNCSAKLRRQIQYVGQLRCCCSAYCWWRIRIDKLIKCGCQQPPASSMTIMDHGWCWWKGHHYTHRFIVIASLSSVLPLFLKILSSLIQRNGDVSHSQAQSEHAKWDDQYARAGRSNVSAEPENLSNLCLRWHLAGYAMSSVSSGVVAGELSRGWRLLII